MRTKYNRGSSIIAQGQCTNEAVGRSTALAARSRYSVPGPMVGELRQKNSWWLMILHTAHGLFQKISPGSLIFSLKHGNDIELSL